MEVTVIKGQDLSPQLIARWSEIQKTSEMLENPYFCPEFTMILSQIRNDVFIGIMKEKGLVKGFFPFHLKRKGIAHPIGLGLSDYHGVISDMDFEWSAEELLRGCNLIRWEFNHLLSSQSQFSAFHKLTSDSAIIELSNGIDSYEKSLGRSGRKQLKEVQRKKKKLEEQIGPITYISHSTDRKILEQLMNWKSEQCKRTGTIDIFSLKWCREFVTHIHSNRNPSFGGILTCLYAGKTLASVHFAMYSQTIWHSWFPTYNHDLEEYSPGSILLQEMINDASVNGIKHIDLGKGISLYKKRVMTNGIKVSEGAVVLPSLRNSVFVMKNQIKNWEKRTSLKPLLRLPVKMIKKMERKGKYA